MRSRENVNKGLIENSDHGLAKKIRDAFEAGEFEFSNLDSITKFCADMKEIEDEELRYELFIVLAAKISLKDNQTKLIAVAAKNGVLKTDQQILDVIDTLELEVSMTDLFDIAIRANYLTSDGNIPRQNNLNSIDTINSLQNVIDVMQPLNDLNKGIEMTNNQKPTYFDKELKPRNVVGRIAGWDLSKFTSNSIGR